MAAKPATARLGLTRLAAPLSEGGVGVEYG
jgi:hypothetical protein